jgi:hypothetical protein
MAEDNDTNGWIELTEISQLKSEVEQDPLQAEIPFRLFANRFKSSSQDSEDFIHDPLGVLIQAEKDGVIKDLGLRRETWTVTTHVVNHHQTLSATHLYSLVTANSTESSIGVTLVKKGR